MCSRGEEATTHGGKSSEAGGGREIKVSGTYVEVAPRPNRASKASPPIPVFVPEGCADARPVEALGTPPCFIAFMGAPFLEEGALMSKSSNKLLSGMIVHRTYATLPHDRRAETPIDDAAKEKDVCHEIASFCRASQVFHSPRTTTFRLPKSYPTHNCLPTSRRLAAALPNLRLSVRVPIVE